MPTFTKALERYRRLTHPLMPFPLRCDHCNSRLGESEELSVIRMRAEVRVVHTKCKPKLIQRLSQ